MTISTKPAPPKGYELVVSGKVRPGDLAWNAYDKAWGGPTRLDFETLGSEVKSYFHIARRQRPARTPE